MERYIKNFDVLAVTQERRIALEIVEAGLGAIDTPRAIAREIKFENNILTIQNKTYELSNYKHVYILGFGKSSCSAARTLEGILKDKITGGIAIDRISCSCARVESLVGDHPIAQENSVHSTQKLLELARKVDENDLVLVIVSGGGSALLCGSADEREQGERLYKSFLGLKADITELNTVRKHISNVKGGGLAEILYPARVVSLIFSDVPGGKLSDVASGPTFLDTTTLDEAQNILRKYGLAEAFQLHETSKDGKYFERVDAVEMMSNALALEAMRQKAIELGLSARIMSSALYEDIETTLSKFLSKVNQFDVVLAGGEVKFQVPPERGQGGRNQQTVAHALSKVGTHDLFISFASDGTDNSDFAGAIADDITKKSIEAMGLQTSDFIEKFDTHNLFRKVNHGIVTGVLDSNVADLMMYLKKF